VSAARGFATSVLALLVLLPAGCVSVPDSGPVRDGVSVVPDEGAVEAQYVPEGPTEGAEPAEIVRGYLAAMLAHPTNPGVVREYLSEEAAGDWQPDVGAVIFSGTASIRVSGQHVQLTVSQLGSLDERGSWSSTPRSRSEHKVDLTLVQQEGEWRISNPPQGMLIREDFFEDRYQAYSLYFLDPTATTLVPEQVYLPDGEQTATLLMRGLVSGPTDWMRGSVDSLLTDSSDPALSVPVDGDGIATVPIGTDAMSYRAEERQLLAAQLAWTLDQLPEVRSIRVTSDGAPVSLIERQQLLDVDFGPKFDPADDGASRTLFALQDGGIVTVPEPDGGGEITSVPGPLGSGDVDIEAFGIDREGKTAAFVDGGSLGVASLSADSPEVDYWFDQGESLLAPQWDRFGLVWAVDRRADGSAVFTIRDGTPQSVEVADEPRAPERIERFAVARDGMRIAVIDGTGADSRLLAARVVRPDDPGGQLRIDRWREIITPSEPLSHFRDLSWASPTELAVLARRDNETHEAFTVDIDGSDVQVSTLIDFSPQAVAATPTQDMPTVVSGDDGRLYNQTNERWTQYIQTQGNPQLSRPTYVE
jgi:hypothetical protein